MSGDKASIHATDAIQGDVLCVAHGHILRAFAMRWIGKSLEEGPTMLLEAGGVGTLSYEHSNGESLFFLFFLVEMYWELEKKEVVLYSARYCVVVSPPLTPSPPYQRPWFIFFLPMLKASQKQPKIKSADEEYADNQSNKQINSGRTSHPPWWIIRCRLGRKSQERGKTRGQPRKIE